MRQPVLAALFAWLLSGCALLDIAQDGVPPETPPALAVTPAGVVAPATPTWAADTVAVVNGVRLMRADLDRRMALIQVAGWLANGARPGDLDESLQVDKWVDSELLAQAAAQAGLGASDGDARAEIDRLIATAGTTRTELDRQLALGGAGYDDLVRYESRLVLVQRFIGGDAFAGSEIERQTKLATWLVRARASAKIEKPAQRAAPATAGTYAGSRAPDFSARGLDGADHSLADLRGRVALMNFWATWCGPCRAEMPAIQAVYDAHRAEGFTVWGINSGEDASLIPPYMQQLNLNFPVMLDRDSRISRMYRVFALPTTYFIGRDGIITQVIIGEMNEASLDATVKKLLQ